MFNTNLTTEELTDKMFNWYESYWYEPTEHFIEYPKSYDRTQSAFDAFLNGSYPVQLIPLLSGG